MQAEATYWRRRGKKYKVAGVEMRGKLQRLRTTLRPYGCPADNQLEFYQKYLRETLISHCDPFLQQKQRQYRQHVGESHLGSEFLPRMVKDIHARNLVHRTCLDTSAED